MNNSQQYTISRNINHEVKINRSTFIGRVAHAASVMEAEAFIEDVRKKNFNATHNCFAYRIEENQFRFSDDGEPAGTAGRPILSMLEKYNLIQTGLIITRFFGGKKLGRGGLRRAYSQTAEEIITMAGIKKVVLYDAITVNCTYNFVSKLHYLITKYSGLLINSNINLEATISVKIPKKLSKEFINEISHFGADKIHIKDKE
jgi:uncharacterized YigZ family protein